MNQRVLMSFVAAAAVAAAAPAHAIECFSMYDARNALVYQTPTAPIDLSRSIEDQMARRFPARYLVIADASPCGQGNPNTVAARGAAVLLSNVGDNARPGNGDGDGNDYAADPYSAPPLPTATAPASSRTRATTRSGAGRR